MNQEATFRTVLAVGFLAVLAYPLSPPSILGFEGKARSTAGRPVHPRDVASRGSSALAGRPRLLGPSRLDDLVLGAPPRWVAVGGSGPGRGWPWAARLDPPEPRHEPDRYGGHQACAHPGHPRAVSLDTASVLRRHGVADPGDRPDRGELVHPGHRRGRLRSVGRAVPDRRSEPLGALW